MKTWHQNKLSNLLPSCSCDNWLAYEWNKQQKQRQHHFKRQTALTNTTSGSPSTIVNLSGVTLTNVEFHVLLRGLSFCLTPCYLNKDHLVDDLESYYRHIHLKKFFLDQTEEDSDIVSPFHPRSTWMPPKGRNAALETYIKKVRKDVNHQIKLLQNKTPQDNLSSAERKALKNLWHWQEIIIKPANKDPQ